MLFENSCFSDLKKNSCEVTRKMCFDLHIPSLNIIFMASFPHNSLYLVPRPIVVLHGICGPTESDLNDPVGVQAPLLHRPTEGRPVGNLLPQHRVACVRVGVDMDHSQGTVPLLGTKKTLQTLPGVISVSLSMNTSL